MEDVRLSSFSEPGVKNTCFESVEHGQVSRVLEIGEYSVWMGRFLEFDLGFPKSVSALVLRSQRVKHLKEMGSKIERVGRGVVRVNFLDTVLQRGTEVVATMTPVMFSTNPRLSHREGLF